MRIGSLFSGYGGLCELAVAPLLGATVAWHSEIGPDPARILSHRWPSTPNIGDITKVDWSQVEPVDVLTGGFPCQDLSHAGKRLGIKPGTRSGLWSHMAYAVSQLRPALVVIENVRGILSAPAHSDLEPCPWCLGDGEDGVLRALGAVLGDLSGLGYDARWGVVRAADAGAPHGRARIFIVATDTSGEPWSLGDGDDVRAGRGTRRLQPATGGGAARGETVGLGAGLRTGEPGRQWRGRPDDNGASALVADADLAGLEGSEPAGRRFLLARGAAPDPGGERHGRGQDGRGVGRVDGPDAGGAREREWSREVAVGGGAAAAADADGGHAGQERLGSGQAPRDTHPRPQPGRVDPPTAWGAYEPAIRRWERLTRPAPAPTEVGAKGQPRLSPRFVEWLMGLPDGHVTDVPGLSRNAQLKALGNGVCPQQAALALSLLLDRCEVAA